MLKKTITYSDLEGNEVTEDFYFNMSKSELVVMQMTAKDGLEKQIEAAVADEDGAKIIALFQMILRAAYGKKSEDGKRFIKSPELSAEFEQTDAYNQLFMELVTNSHAAAAFINGILPKDLVRDVEEKQLPETATDA